MVNFLWIKLYIDVLWWVDLRVVYFSCNVEDLFKFSLMCLRLNVCGMLVKKDKLLICVVSVG